MRGRFALVALGLTVIFGCRAVLGPAFEPVAAWVAVEGTDGVARAALVRLGSGEPIRLHAVLEGRDGEERVFYTNAERLELGGEEIAAEAIRPWPDRPVRCQWQTLQAAAPYLEIDDEAKLDSLKFTNFSQPDWGLECSVVATITARQRETMTVPDDARRLAFGRHSYQVRIELPKKETDLIAETSFRSPGSDDLFADPEKFPRVLVALDGPLAAPSAVFGLSQLEPTEDLSDDAVQKIGRLHAAGLFFRRALLFAELLGGAELDWQLVEFDAGKPFTSDPEPGAVAPGDWIRVGDRVMILFRDVGEVGVLDGADLGFDFERGAIVRRLSDVFVGEGDVQWAAAPTR